MSMNRIFMVVSSSFFFHIHWIILTLIVFLFFVFWMTGLCNCKSVWCEYLYIFISYVFFLHLYMHSVLFIAPISICLTRDKEGVLLHWLGQFVSLHQHQAPVQPYIYQSASTPDTCPTLHLSVCINTRHLSNPTFISVHQHQTPVQPYSRCHERKLRGVERWHCGSKECRLRE